jgi:hypothetical protein
LLNFCKFKKLGYSPKKIPNFKNQTIPKLAKQKVWKFLSNAGPYPQASLDGLPTYPILGELPYDFFENLPKFGKSQVMTF